MSRSVLLSTIIEKGCLLRRSTRSCSALTHQYLGNSSVKARKSKVPQVAVYKHIDESQLPPRTKITKAQVQLLEKLSLVDFANKEGTERLEEAIRIADHLCVVDTEGVEPMITVLEDRCLHMADDVVNIENQQDELLACASETLEDYFVVPPGNINFVPDEGYYQRLENDKT
ncbi:glutamyl-tRNA(Gln) amidotransferase subunit C, mitochondrial [Oratosquilla oratoria]|uniref:glutamyl-tRNA(Gln) amidotransferase subunit C, mitochondrial n=1 Tax=Oratosquilla oratoria TaxID=337810 RepID=UPI003F76CFCA